MINKYKEMDLQRKTFLLFPVFLYNFFGAIYFSLADTFVLPLSYLYTAIAAGVMVTWIVLFIFFKNIERDARIALSLGVIGPFLVMGPLLLDYITAYPMKQETHAICSFNYFQASRSGLHSRPAHILLHLCDSAYTDLENLRSITPVDFDTSYHHVTYTIGKGIIGIRVKRSIEFTK